MAPPSPPPQPQVPRVERVPFLPEAVGADWGFRGLFYGRQNLSPGLLVPPLLLYGSVAIVLDVLGSNLDALLYLFDPDWEKLLSFLRAGRFRFTFDAYPLHCTLDEPLSRQRTHHLQRITYTVRTLEERGIPSTLPLDPSQLIANGVSTISSPRLRSAIVDAIAENIIVAPLSGVHVLDAISLDVDTGVVSETAFQHFCHHSAELGYQLGASFSGRLHVSYLRVDPETLELTLCFRSPARAALNTRALEAALYSTSQTTARVLLAANTDIVLSHAVSHSPIILHPTWPPDHLFDKYRHLIHTLDPTRVDASVCRLFRIFGLPDLWHIAALVQYREVRFSRLFETSEEFRGWLHASLAEPSDDQPDVLLRKALAKSLGKTSIPMRTRLLRFFIFEGLEAVAGAFVPLGGPLTAAFHTFLLDRLAPETHPHIFSPQVDTLLRGAESASAAPAGFGPAFAVAPFLHSPFNVNIPFPARSTRRPPARALRKSRGHRH